MRIKLGILSVFLFVAFFYLVYASNVKFYSVNSLYGISMRETASVCKDDNGFIWTASKTGVLRVADGSYRHYQLPYKTADIISVRLEYKDSVLLAYTNNGQFFVYNELYDRFDFMADLRELPNSMFIVIHKVFSDDSGFFWIASSSGLYKYSKNNSSWTAGIHDLVYYATPYNEQSLFYSTDKGTYLLDKISEKSVKLVDGAQYENKVSKLFYDKGSHYLWIGTQSAGLFFYDLNRKRLNKVPIKNFPKQPVLAIEENSDSTLLIGIDGQGIWEINRTGDSLLNVYKEDSDNPYSLHGDGVYDIYCDNNQRVWIVTNSGGLSFFEQKTPVVNQITHQINSSNSLGNNNVNKVLQDSRGNLWFATNNGMSRWQRDDNKWDTFYQNNPEQAQVFLALCEDDSGNIWAGTYSSGVYVLDGKTGRELNHFSLGKNASFQGEFIFDIYKDSDGDIWIGGIDSDVICYRSGERRFVSYPSQPVRSFRELEPGKILLACTWGLILLDKQTGGYDVLQDGFLCQDVMVRGNDLWVGTCGDGLLHLDYSTKELRKYTIEHGLVSNCVNSVMCADDNVWLGTENGLCRLNPQDGVVITYQSIFSLSKLAFNISSKYRLEDGDLIFGTNNGAIVFNPDKLYQTSLSGKIFFQDIEVAGQSIRENRELLQKIPINQQKKLQLKYNQNNLTLELIPVGVSAESVKFSWKMDGLDSDWSSPSEFPIIAYTNIPSGKFKLSIRMLDGSLSQIIDERLLTIKITPPFWKAWWFFLILTTILVSIVYFAMRFYIERLKQRHSQDKIRFFTNMAHDIRTSLTLISAPIEEVNKIEDLPRDARHYLNLASEQSTRLSFVATQLLDFQKVDIGRGQLFLVSADIVELVGRRKSMFEATASKNDINLKFKSNKESCYTGLDVMKIEKVVDNLISNAIKYSKDGGVVEVTLTCDENNWKLEVKDYGMGISETAKGKLFREFYRGDNAVNSRVVGSGIGLLLVKSYVTMHGGNVHLDTKEGVGTSFVIDIPKKAADFEEMPAISAPDQVMVDFQNDQLSLSESISEDVTPTTQILIVEDHNDLQKFLEYAFKDHFDITLASDGVEAWKIINDSPPDLIISDVMMPRMDGFELCKLIKTNNETSHIPVILLTALSEKTDQLEGLGLGADDYITKPFDMTLLMQRIQSILHNRRVVQERMLQLIKKEDHETEPVVKNSLNDKFVKQALEVVMNNLSNSEFSRDDFASEMNVSNSLLYKKIKAITGQSPGDFLRTIRLNRSVELLKSGEYTVTEVSELCGYSSVGYFSYSFRKHFGHSPSESS